MISLSEEDICYIEGLLSNGLPDDDIVRNFLIIFIISIGNSMGWPYKQYIDFDVSNIDYITNKEVFKHVIAHEIHHIVFNSLINDIQSPQSYFLVNFAFEGLAVYYNNNAKTLNMNSKYKGEMIGIDEDTWSFYDDQFDELFIMFKNDLYYLSNKTTE